jgi:hypothetical protein
MQGFGRVKRLGLVGYNAVDHILRVKIGYNGDPVWADTLYLDSSALETFDEQSHYGAGLSTSYKEQAYLLQFLGSQMRMTSIRVQISDVEAMP